MDNDIYVADILEIENKLAERKLDAYYADSWEQSEQIRRDILALETEQAQKKAVKGIDSIEK